MSENFHTSGAAQGGAHRADLGDTKVTSSYHLCVECFSQLSFDSEVYTKSATAADFVYTSESNESCEKHSTER